jgi:hypothetical protein
VLKRLSQESKMRIILLSLFFSSTFLARAQFHETRNSLDELVNEWHVSAAKANFQQYFDVTTNDFIFLGTAPGERWNKVDFQSFCKPYFDKGKAWDFKPSNRQWNVISNGTVAYFDEDLQTWMESCRGSGICVLENGEWKIAYYNLTVLIENEKIKEFIKLRKE